MRAALSAFVIGAAVASAAGAQNFEVAIQSDHFGSFLLNPLGAPIPMGATETFSFGPMFVSGPDHFLRFDVIATNTSGTAFDLTLTNLEFRSTVPTPGAGWLPDGEFLRLTLTADFASVAGTYTPQHEVNGTMWIHGGQTAFVEKVSVHNSTPVFSIGSFASASQSFATGTTFGAAFASGTTYTIWTEYSFGITAGSFSYGSIELPSSGHDRGQIVPTPGVGAGLAGGLLVATRRRRHGPV